MSDIFDEKEDLRNTRGIMIALRHRYDEKMRHKGDEAEYMVGNVSRTGIYNVEPLYLRDPDEMARCTALALHWPGDDVVRQIIIDTIKTLIENDVNLHSVKW